MLRILINFIITSFLLIEKHVVKCSLVTTTANVQQYLGNNEHINVNINNNFDIPLRTIAAQLDSSSEDYRKIESSNYIYRRRITDSTKDCQLIGNAFLNTTEHSFVLCGKQIRYLSNNFQTNNQKKFYDIDWSKEYLTIKPLEDFSSGIDYELYCHGVHNLLGQKDLSKQEPVFVCSYQYKKSSKENGITRLGFITKTKPNKFLNLGYYVEDCIFNTKLCPFYYPDDNKSKKGNYTSVIIVTSEAVNMKRRQGNTVVDEKAFLFLYNQNKVIGNETDSKLITLKMNELNSPQTFSAYSVSCVNYQTNHYKFYLHFMQISSVNYQGNSRLLEIQNIESFSKIKSDFTTRSQEISSNNISDYRIFFENIPGNNEALVFSQKEKASPKAYEYQSCILKESLAI